MTEQQRRWLDQQIQARRNHPSRYNRPLTTVEVERLRTLARAH